MITGDHPDTAHTIGGWIGITTEEVLTGARMQQMTDEELGAAVLHCNIYARASPEHKLRIVRALQKHGHVCAMTGDGVNDAPALRQAEVGVAMGITGTEVAKEAAKMILADDNFATIVKAVKEGRVVYENLIKIMLFALPTVSVAAGVGRRGEGAGPPHLRARWQGCSALSNGCASHPSHTHTPSRRPPLRTWPKASASSPRSSSACPCPWRPSRC